MKVSVNLQLKGTTYYAARELLKNKFLKSGVELRLEHQRENPHDKNAVAVLVKKSGEMLGHISRHLAPKYSKLVDAGKIIEASISNVSHTKYYVWINVDITYELTDADLEERHNSLLWKSASNMPSSPGVYAIKNIESGKIYVGASNNMKKRISRHLRNLLNDYHDNYLLQSDFIQYGVSCFESIVLSKDIEISSLPAVESDCISSMLDKGVSLYNLTTDGQGVGFKPWGYKKSEPMSDWLAKQHDRMNRSSIESKERTNEVTHYQSNRKGCLSNLIIGGFMILAVVALVLH